MTFRELLETEFLKRARRNSRYSIRAFARRLGVDHSTLSQWLRGERPLTARAIEQAGWRLGFMPRELRAYLDETPLDMTSQRVLDAIRREPLIPDTRTLAERLAVSPDVVNIALQRLLRRGLLQLESDRRWRVL